MENLAVIDRNLTYLVNLKARLSPEELRRYADQNDPRTMTTCMFIKNVIVSKCYVNSPRFPITLGCSWFLRRVVGCEKHVFLQTSNSDKNLVNTSACAYAELG